MKAFITGLFDFYTKHQYTLFLILSIVIGLSPILWFDGRIIAGEEFYALDYEKWGKLYSYGWSNAINYGEHTILFPFRFQQYFFALLRNLGFIYYYSLIFWHVMLWVITSVSFYVLLKEVFNKMIPAYILFLGTLLYVFNPFFLNISVLLTPPRILFAMLPLIHYFGIKYVRETGENYLYLTLMNLIIFVASPIFVNLPYGLILLIPVFLLITFKNLIKTYDSLVFVKQLIFTVGLFLILNSWWLVPTLSKIIEDINEIEQTGASFVTIQGTHVSDVLSFGGSWAFRETIGGYDYLYFPYSVEFDKYPLVLLKNIPFLMIALGLIHLLKIKERSSEKLILVYFSFIYILFAFMAKGSNGLLGNLFEYMYKNFPFFWIFREPYSKFMPLAAVSGAIIFTLGLHFLIQIIYALKSRFRIGLYTISLLTVVLSIFLIVRYFFSDEINWNINDIGVRSYYIQYSETWERLVNEWKPSDNGYYLAYPSSGFTEKVEWPSGYSGNPFLMTTNAHIINPISGYIENNNVKNVTTYLYVQAFENPKRFIEISERFNISGLISQGELIVAKFTSVKNQFSDDYGDKLSYRDDKTDIYEVNPFPSLISLVNTSGIYSMHAENFKLYSVARFLSPDNLYYKITKSTQEIVEALRDNKGLYFLIKDYKLENNPTSVFYDLKELPEGDYTFVFEDYENNLTQILLDGRNTEIKRDGSLVYLNFTKTQECCGELRPVFKGAESLKLSETWIKYDTRNLIELDQTASQTLDLTDQSTAYLKKLDDFDTDAQYFVNMSGEYEGSSRFYVHIIQKIGKNEGIYPLYSFLIPSLNGNYSLTLDDKKTSIDTTKNAEHYLMIQKVLMNPNTHDTGEPAIVNITNLEIKQMFNPDIMAISGRDFYTRKNTDFSENPVDVEYSRPVEYIIVGDIGGAALSKTLVFKESYSDSWKMAYISDSEKEFYINNGRSFLAKIKLLLLGKNSINSENIEFYANGWQLDESQENKSFVLFFMPSIISDVLLPISLIISVILMGLFLYRVVKHKIKVKNV